MRFCTPFLPNFHFLSFCSVPTQLCARRDRTMVFPNACAHVVVHLIGTLRVVSVRKLARAASLFTMVAVVEGKSLCLNFLDWPEPLNELLRFDGAANWRPSFYASLDIIILSLLLLHLEKILTRASIQVMRLMFLGYVVMFPIALVLTQHHLVSYLSLLSCIWLILPMK